MASKIHAFKRFPFRGRFLSASRSAAGGGAHSPPANHDPVFESAIRYLKSKLQPDKFVSVLDSLPDLDSSLRVFRWASAQKNFWHSSETYANIVLKLGMEGNHLPEMDSFLKEMTKLCSSEGGGEAFDRLVDSFSRNHRPREALLVVEAASLARCKVSLPSFNALMRTLVFEEGDFRTGLFVYKEMTKAEVLPDVETLNCLIHSLCRIGRMDLALDQFNKMRNKWVSPDLRTFEILIAALFTDGRAEESVLVLNQLFEMSCRPNLPFCTAVVPLLCRAGRSEVAFKLFRMMKDGGVSPDLYLFGVLIRSFCESKLLDDALDLLDEAVEQGLQPSTCMYTDIVNGYCEADNFAEAMGFLAEAEASEVEPCNALLRSLCNKRRFVEASSYLEEMMRRDTCDALSWNVLMRGLCETGDVSGAFQVLGRMIGCAFSPDPAATYSAIIVGYCRNGEYEAALGYFSFVRLNHIPIDPESCSELIGVCSYAGKIQEATEVFGYAASRGLAIGTSPLAALIRGVCLEGRVDEAIKLRSVAYCGGTPSVLSTFAPIFLRLSELQKTPNILVLLSQFLVEGCKLDRIAYDFLIRTLCAAQSTAREAALLFNQMVDDGSFIPDPETLEVLLPCLTKYSKVHSVALRLEKLRGEEGLIGSKSFNLIIYGLLKEGHKDQASKFLDWMLEKGWVPEAETHILLVRNNREARRRQEFVASEHAGDDDRVIDILAEGFGTSDRAR